MSALTLIEDEQASLTLDPVDSEDRTTSIAFDVLFTWKMPYEESRILMRERWIGIDAIKRFEAELPEIEGGQRESATLVDLSNRKIVSVAADIIVIESSDSHVLGKNQFTITSYPSVVKEMSRRLREYPKWW